MSCDSALQRLKRVRPSVQPNESFMSQLHLYETLLKSYPINSVVMNWYCLQHKASGVSKRNKVYPAFSREITKFDFDYYLYIYYIDYIFYFLDWDTISDVMKTIPSEKQTKPALKCKVCR